MRLLLATRNPGKVAELERMLVRHGWEVISLDEVAVKAVEEDGATFEENARKKARAAASVFHGWVLAEDSGLEVDALSGEPGVMSARFAGRDASDRERNRLLLDRIIAVPDDARTARFRCVACLVDPQGHERLFDGVCEGRIAPHMRGHGGFGYDPLFIPEGYSKTFAELGFEVKNRISHRAKAVSQVVKYLRAQVQAPDAASQV